MKYPIIADYVECKTYFKDLYDMNNVNKDEAVSFRDWAKFLNWPVSYLNEVILGKRTLTLMRALEFARATKMSIVETERLIYMSLQGSSSGIAQGYFLEKLNTEYNSDSSTIEEKKFAGLKDEFNTCNEEIKNDLATSAVLKLLVWSQGKIKREDISELLYTFPELSDPSKVDEKILKLERNGNLKIISLNNSGLVEVEMLRASIHFTLDPESIRHHALFPDNMARLLRHPKCAGIFNAGLINIKREDLKEVTERISMFRNWLLEINKRAEAGKTDDPTDSLLFQYDLNLAALIDYRKLGISNLRDWGV